MDQYTVQKVGTIRVDGDSMRIILDSRFASALKGLDGFSHIQVLWWFDRCDNEQCRSRLQESAPYAAGPVVLGTFATRSPLRPNPMALSCSQMIRIDHDNAAIELAYIDAEDGTPVLDIKPYTPSLDRVENPSVPGWCAHWPKSCEASGDFDWEKEFLF